MAQCLHSLEGKTTTNGRKKRKKDTLHLKGENQLNVSVCSNWPPSDQCSAIPAQCGFQNPGLKIYFQSTGVLDCQSINPVKWFPSAMAQKYPDDSLFLLWSGNLTASQHGGVLILAPLCLASRYLSLSLSVSIFSLLNLTFCQTETDTHAILQFLLLLLLLYNKPLITLL